MGVDNFVAGEARNFGQRAGSDPVLPGAIAASGRNGGIELLYNVPMRATFVLLLTYLSIVLAPASAQDCTPGNWTIANQPPDSCIPYASRGYFTKPLPGAGSGGPLAHLFPNSAAIISNTMASHDLGLFKVGDPNNHYDDILSEPIYYGRVSDPLYRITSCQLNSGTIGDAAHNPVGQTFHIPNAAQFGNSRGSFGFSDQFFVVWDQVSNKILSAYNYARPNISLPACTATDPAKACPTPSWRSCDQADFSSDTGYQVWPGGNGALDVPGWALAIRTNEWVYGRINHALYLNTACEASGVVFPDLRNAALICANQTNRPHEGNLVFLDYTDAQINAMNLPAWQEPIITALAHYGGYIGDTNNNQGSINVSRLESNQAYKLAGLTSPLYAWLEGQPGVTKRRSPEPGTHKYIMYTFANLPNLTGPSCPSPCNYVGHLHIADPCVALGLAGLPGGCVPPQPAAKPKRKSSH